jgi:hypothetical protein
VLCLHIYSLSLEKIILNLKVISRDEDAVNAINRKLKKYGFWHSNIEVYSDAEDRLFHTECNNFNEL